MASTGIGANNGGNAVVFPQDEGTGTPAPNDSNADLDAAGFFGLIARNTGEAYKIGATFSNIDTSADTIDIGSGVVFVRESGNTVTTGSGTTYNTTLPEDMVYAVALPTSETIDLDTSTSANLRLVVNPGAQDTVTVEHNTSPTNPSLIIGDADTNTGDFSDSNLGPRFAGTDVETRTITGADSGNKYDVDFELGGVDNWDLSLVARNLGVSGGIASGQYPAAVYAPESNKTFFAWQGPTQASSDGNPYISVYKHDVGSFGRTIEVGQNNLSAGDGHGEPTIVIESKESAQGHIYVIYGNHNDVLTIDRLLTGDQEIGTGTSAQDTSATPPGTYPCPDIHTSTQDIYVAMRPGDGSHNQTYPGHEYGGLIVGTGGYDRSWSDLGPIADLTDHPSTDQDFYIRHSQMHQDRFYISFTIAQGTGHDDTKYGAYLIYYDINDGNVYAPDGTSFGSTPTFTDLDGSNAQLAPDDIQVSYQTHFLVEGYDDIHYAHPDSTNGKTNYHHWDGSSWTEEVMNPTIKFCHPMRIDGEIMIMTGRSSGGRSMTLMKRNGGNWDKYILNDQLSAPGGGYYLGSAVRDAHPSAPMFIQDRHPIEGQRGGYMVGDLNDIRAISSGGVRRSLEREESNVDTALLAQEEAIFDTNRGGSGNTAVVYKDSTGTVHYWDADGTL